MNLDFNSKSPLSKAMNGVIDESLEKQNKKQTPRTYLGGSRLGVECERALQFEYFNTPKDEGKDFPGRVLRIFRRGHWAEDYLIECINDAGFDLRTEKPNSKEQYGFSVMQDKIQGHCDGVFLDGKGIFETPALWECKCIQEKDFNILKREGVQKKYPVYYGQMQVYQAYLQLTEHPAIFTAISANTMSIYWELVPFNPQAAQELSDKGVKIIQACENGELLPKMSNDPASYKCKWCSWCDRCHNL